MLNTLIKLLSLEEFKESKREDYYMSGFKETADGIIDSIWWYINDEHNLQYVNNYCEDFDKFLTWFDYICVECFAQEITAIYKQRLLDFE